MKRKTIFKKFKSQTFSHILLDKHPVRFVSNQLEIHENILCRWVSEYEK